jgi:hypothetical protein
VRRLLTTSASVILGFPVRRRLYPAIALAVHPDCQGFHLTVCRDIRYTSHSPRTGKLRARCQAYRNRLWCSHGSDEMAVEAAVSRVGRLRRMSQDVADTPRWLSGRAQVAADRQHLTSANDDNSTTKTEQRKPATRWAMRRKASRAVSHRTMRTKPPHSGPTDAARGLSTYGQGYETYERTHASGHMTRHGSGAYLLSAFPLYRGVSLALSLGGGQG